MDEPSHETGDDVAIHSDQMAYRIAIGVVLATAVFGAIYIWMPYERERRDHLRGKIESFGGNVGWQYSGPRIGFKSESREV